MIDWCEAWSKARTKSASCVTRLGVDVFEVPRADLKLRISSYRGRDDGEDDFKECGNMQVIPGSLQSFLSVAKE